MTEPYVLLVEDSPAAATLAKHALAAGGVRVEHCATLGAALARLADAQLPRPSAVVLDLTLPDSSGVATFDRLAAAGPPPVVVLSGEDDPSQAVALIERGAQDYLVKGESSGPAIARSVRQAIERSRLQEPRTRPSELPGQIPPELADLAEQYLLSRCADVEALRAAVSSSDFGEARRRGHNMKGSGSGYGFPRVSQLGARIERAADGRDGAELNRCADALLAYAEKELASID